MKSVKFKGYNLDLAKNQPEYETLPVLYQKDSRCGEMVSCFKFSFLERIKILFGGKLWLTQLTFRQGFHPIYMSLEKNEHIKIND